MHDTTPPFPQPGPGSRPQPVPPPRRDPRVTRQALTGGGALGLLIWLAWSIAAQLASGAVNGNNGTISALHGWCAANASALGDTGSERACALISDGYLLAAIVFWLSIAALIVTLGLLLMAAAPWKHVR